MNGGAWAPGSGWLSVSFDLYKAMKPRKDSRGIVQILKEKLLGCKAEICINLHSLKNEHKLTYQALYLSCPGLYPGI